MGHRSFHGASTRMAALRRWIDPYLLMLLGTVGLAALFPARGMWASISDEAVTIAVALLFFLYGARLAPAADRKSVV